MTVPETRPLPTPSAISRPFWHAAREGRLLIQRCDACGAVQHPPGIACRACLGSELAWHEAAGSRHVYSFTIVHRSMTAGFIGDEPYVVALVELDEGVRMTTNILGCPPDAVRIGLRVVPRFTPVTDDIALAHFAPADGAATA